jgi:hypothetical protein
MAVRIRSPRDRQSVILATHDQRDDLTTIRSKTGWHAGIFTGKQGR